MISAVMMVDSPGVTGTMFPIERQYCLAVSYRPRLVLYDPPTVGRVVRVRQMERVIESSIMLHYLSQRRVFPQLQIHS
jgi:hypothetical protein